VAELAELLTSLVALGVAKVQIRGAVELEAGPPAEASCDEVQT
jgi:hypothetical protein